MILNKSSVRRFVRAALNEDAAHQDVTTRDFIPASVRVEARVVAGQRGVVCGVPFAQEAFRVFDRTVRVTALKKEGSAVRRGDVVLKIKGRGRTVLSCERVALNFLSYLSGIATQTHEAVKRVRSKGIQVLDTRKTTPLLRFLEKYAVSVGGGRNHRFDLGEQYLLKENHIHILRLSRINGLLKKRRPVIPFEVEAESLKEFEAVLALDPDIVMLDNFSPGQVRRALARLARLCPDRRRRPLIELSGGMRIANLSRYAIRGVDFISLGSLTHSSPALDFSLELTRCNPR